jgi:hypothetical protein
MKGKWSLVQGYFEKRYDLVPEVRIQEEGKSNVTPVFL